MTNVTNNYVDRTNTIISFVNKAIKKLTFRFQAKVKSEKLTGQVLNVRTGRLRRSMNTSFQEEESGLISGFLGTNVPYAKPHEFGFEGEVQVQEYMMTQKQVFGRMLQNPIQVTVKAHMRKVKIPEKSFMRSALGEMRDEITEAMNDAISRGLNGDQS